MDAAIHAAAALFSIVTPAPAAPTFLPIGRVHLADRARRNEAARRDRAERLAQHVPTGRDWVRITVAEVRRQQRGRKLAAIVRAGGMQALDA